MNFNFRKSIREVFIHDLFTYSTTRSASIKSYKIGLLYRLIQLVLLSYIVGWELIHQRGYQAFETVSSVVTTKVKGQGFVPVNTNRDKSLNKNDPLYYEKLFRINPNVSYRILDTADYIIPPNEYNSVFIMSNFIETYQSQGVCDEEQNKYKAICKQDSDCQSLGTAANAWNGIPTGKCINSSVNKNLSVCEIRAWCPAEHDSDRKEDTLIRNILSYTIFIKNDIEFKKFKRKEAPNLTNTYISQCTYDTQRDPFCPVFQIGYILEMAEPDKAEKYQMMFKGGVILIEIIWNCNYDRKVRCLPQYSFRRFDTKESNTASGFNFRFANKYREGGKDYRVLVKAYGLRFIINVSGQAGKFDIVPLMISIGTGFGLMSLSVIVADCVLLHCTKNKDIYQRIKELELKDDEVENIGLEDANDPLPVTPIRL